MAKATCRQAVVKRCVMCQKHRNSPAPAPLHPWEWPSKPWQRLLTDYAGPLMGHVFDPDGCLFLNGWMLILLRPQLKPSQLSVFKRVLAMREYQGPLCLIVAHVLWAQNSKNLCRKMESNTSLLRLIMLPQMAVLSAPSRHSSQ